ncbi:hypothetical protein Q8A73_007081 [Channa argus]|nr:hypothetical protein Q8A73_007081 [Channa argus]
MLVSVSRPPVQSAGPYDAGTAVSSAEAFLPRNFNYRKSPYGTPLSLIPDHIHISRERLSDSLVAATKATRLLALSLIKVPFPLMATKRVEQAALSECFDQAFACFLSPFWPRVALRDSAWQAWPGPWGQGLEKVAISDDLPLSLLPPP